MNATKLRASANQFLQESLKLQKGKISDEETLDLAEEAKSNTREKQREQPPMKATLQSRDFLGFEREDH